MCLDIEMYEKMDKGSLEACEYYNRLSKSLTDKYIFDKENLIFDYRYKIKNLSYEMECALETLNKSDLRDKMIKLEKYKKQLYNIFIEEESKLLEKYNLDMETILIDYKNTCLTNDYICFVV